MADRAQDTEAIRAALDLGLQAWRTTASRTRFHDAFDALNRLEVAAENRDQWHSASNEAQEENARLVARLEAAEQERDEARAGWDGWQERCFAVEEELAAALAAAVPGRYQGGTDGEGTGAAAGETSVAPGLVTPSEEDAARLTAAGPGAAAAAPGETTEPQA